MSGAGSGGSRGNGPSSATTAAIPIPSGSRKLVHSLKEIVNCSEAEIYAMLCECNMDPDAAVNRLLSQGARPLKISFSLSLSPSLFLSVGSVSDGSVLDIKLCDRGDGHDFWSSLLMV